MRPLMSAGVKQRHRVVDPSIDVDDHGLNMLGHGVNLPAIS